MAHASCFAWLGLGSFFVYLCTSLLECLRVAPALDRLLVHEIDKLFFAEQTAVIRVLRSSLLRLVLHSLLILKASTL